jgi:hypothetical protein
LVAKFLPDTYILNVLDSLANISASFDTLETYASGIFTVRFTDSGTPTLDLTAAQVVNDQSLIAKIVGSHTVVLEDSAANIAANFNALDSVATSFSSFSFTDSGTPALHLTASQIINDEFLISKLNFMAVHIVLDDAAATIVANIATLENDSSPLTSVEFTDSGTPTIDLTATVFVSSEPLIGKFTGPYDIALADSAATIQSDFGSLSNHASEITSVQFTDSGTPSLDLTAVQVVSDQTLIGKITGSYDLVVEDSTTNIASRFVGLETDASEIASVQFTGSAPFALDLTAAETINDQALIGKITSTYSLVVKDSAATITSDLSSLEQYASEISSIQFNNSGTPTIDLTASQVAGYQSLIEKFTGSYNLVVSDSAADVASNFGALENCVSEITSVQFTDTGTPNLDLTAAQVVGDQALVAKITSPYNLVVSDSAANFASNIAALESDALEISSVAFTDSGTPIVALSAAQDLADQAIVGKIASPYYLGVYDSAANIQANFDALETYASNLTGVGFTDTGTPTLNLTATQVTNDATLLSKMYDAYDLMVTGVTGQAYTSYESQYGAYDKLHVTTQFDTNGSESITAYVPGLTLTGGSVANTFYLESTSSVSATGGAANDTFFFGTGFSSADSVNGGGGTNILELDGTYTGANALAISTSMISNIQTLYTFAGHSYDITLDAGTVTTGQALTVYGSPLVTGNVLTVDGSALTAGALTIIAGAGVDTFTGGAGSNNFSMGANFTAADAINGGAGSTLVTLDGDYSGGVTFTATTMVNVPELVLDTGYSYDLVLNATTVASGQTMLIDGLSIGASNRMTIDASALTAGTLDLVAGAGVDDFTGGAGTNDFLMRGYLTAGDEITGGTGPTTVTLDGNYASGVTFNATTMVDVPTIDLTTGFSYDLTLNAATIASGGTMSIVGNTLAALNTMTIDASALAAGSSITLDGGAGVDDFIGGAGTNEFVLRGYLTAADEINGGAGTTTVNIDGDYSAGVNFNATTMVNVDTLFMTAGYSYNFTLNAATVTSGQTMTIQGGALGINDTMTIDGSAVTAGTLAIDAGAGVASMTGGAGNDIIRAGSGTDYIYGGLGADKIYAGSGADTFAYGAVAESTSTGYDVISGFNTSLDVIQLGNALSGVTAIDAAVTTGSLASTNFDAGLAHYIGASQLSAHGAVLFTPSTGGLAGDTFLIIDENGVAGYQAAQDLVIELTHGTNLSALSLSNFETAG